LANCAWYYDSKKVELVGNTIGFPKQLLNGLAINDTLCCASLIF